MGRLLEGSWLVLRHGCAAAATALAGAVLPTMLVLLVGLPLCALGIGSTLILPFGADPPLLGFAFGVALTLASSALTLGALLAVAVLAVGWSVAVLTPIALLARAAAAWSRSAALPLELALLFLGGELAGLAGGLSLWLVAETAGCSGAHSTSTLIACATLGPLAGIASAAVYGISLLCADALRAGGGVLARRWIGK